MTRRDMFAWVAPDSGYGGRKDFSPIWIWRASPTLTVLWLGWPRFGIIRISWEKR